MEILCEGRVGVVPGDRSANHADDFRNSGGGLRSSRRKGAQQGDCAAKEHKSTICGRCWGAAFSPTWVSQIPRIPV